MAVTLTPHPECVGTEGGSSSRLQKLGFGVKVPGRGESSRLKVMLSSDKLWDQPGVQGGMKRSNFSLQGWRLARNSCRPTGGRSRRATLSKRVSVSSFSLINWPNTSQCSQEGPLRRRSYFWRWLPYSRASSREPPTGCTTRLLMRHSRGTTVV